MKLYDGFHPVHFELMKYESDFKDPYAFGKGSTQKVYAFPNGYGASVVKGFFTFDYDELAVLKFEKPFRLRSKKKRLKKKFYKRYGMFYDLLYNTPVTSDVKRYSDQDELTKDFNSISRFKPGEF